MSKFLPVVLFLVALSAAAEEQCVFDESAYTGFINMYQADHADSKIDSDGSTLVVTRGEEKIIIHGGGCVHLGMSIELVTRQAYTEAAFLQKVVELSSEFGDWLINTDALKAAVDAGNYQKIKGTYFVDIDAMTVFSAERREQGGILVDFYIN